MTVKLYAALDVSLKKTSVCVMDQDGRIVREFEVASCPDSLARCLVEIAPAFERIGLEAGPMSEWLVRGLAEHGLTAVLMETRQVRTALSSMRAKTDRNDARGMAHLLRMGWWYRPVHVKAADTREQRTRLAARDALVRRVRDLENSVRGLLRGYGLRVQRACVAAGISRSGNWWRGTRAWPVSSNRCCTREPFYSSSLPCSTSRCATPPGRTRSAGG